MQNQNNCSFSTQPRELPRETQLNRNNTGINCQPTLLINKHSSQENSMTTGNHNTTNTPFETATNNSININHNGNTMNNLNKYVHNTGVEVNETRPPPAKKRKTIMSAGNKNSGAVVNVGGFNHGGSSSCINRSPAMSMTGCGHSVGRQRAQVAQVVAPETFSIESNNCNVSGGNTLLNDTGTRFGLDSSAFSREMSANASPMA